MTRRFHIMTRTLSEPPQTESKGRASVKGMVGRVLLSLVILSAVFAITYVLARPWISTWGATRAEATRTLPGDELVLDPTSTNTLAVTIDAPPERVWRWLVQMGVGRGGFYNFLFVENTLMRIGVHNADGIHPEWQDVEVGDHFWFTPKDYPGPRQGPEVVDIQKNRALILCEGKSAKDCPGTWQFALSEHNRGSTRLLFRDKGSSFADLVLELGFVVMNRGMLLGIEQKAEGAPSERSHIERVSLACVVAAALGLVAMLFSRRWWPWTLIVASVGTCLATLVFLVFYPSVAYGLLLALAVLGALMWKYWPQRSRWLLGGELPQTAGFPRMPNRRSSQNSPSTRR
jgi:hypothetical protein